MADFEWGQPPVSVEPEPKPKPEPKPEPKRAKRPSRRKGVKGDVAGAVAKTIEVMEADAQDRDLLVDACGKDVAGSIVDVVSGEGPGDVLRLIVDVHEMDPLEAGVAVAALGEVKVREVWRLLRRMGVDLVERPPSSLTVAATRLARQIVDLDEDRAGRVERVARLAGA